MPLLPVQIEKKHIKLNGKREIEIEILLINFQSLTAARAAAAFAAAIFLTTAPAASASFVLATAAFALIRPNGFGAACDSWR